MPSIVFNDNENTFNQLIQEENNFNVIDELSKANEMKENLNGCQQKAYLAIMDAIHTKCPKVFFLDGPGGTGKTYLYNCILSRIRGEGKIALACASSGIAALLLSKGRTTHSRFKIPLILTTTSTCNIKVNSKLAELIREASLIIWDEAPMTHRFAFEALDKTFKDIMSSKDPFGGKIMLLGGDFRQILPVVQKGTRSDIVNASLCRSSLWIDIEVLKLQQNMRVMSENNSNEKEFVEWILAIGNGKINNKEEDKVSIPFNMLIENRSITDLIHWLYKDLHKVVDYSNYFKERAILIPKNIEVNKVNSIALNAMEGDIKEYLSADSVATQDANSYLYTTEYLNSINLGGGYPPHKLLLKKNAPVMLLRNINPQKGLCNGTRLICKAFYERVIEAQIITGTNIGDIIFLPRITFIPSSLQMSFDMRRRQFPIQLAFAMTINKSQGQTLSHLGIFLSTPVFSHGQLYVALSRVKSSNSIKIFLEEEDEAIIGNFENKETYTTNVVYQEVLELSTKKN